jgi:glycerate kinase
MAASSYSPVIVVAPDSFKGSLDAPAVCEAIARGLRRVWPDADVRLRPMADGGEGTLDAVLSGTHAEGSSRHTKEVPGAGGQSRHADYGLVQIDGHKTAIIEAATIVGITDAVAMALPVAQRSTRGIGELVRALLDQDVRRFMIGLGGSSTNDGGAGMLAALGLKLADTAQREVAPAPESLARIATVDARNLDPRLRQCTITILSDVDNPLCGPRGATATFGPQKGVAAHDIERLDGVLAHFAALTEQAMHTHVAHIAGAGAAGGLGFALQLLGGTVRAGAEVVADVIALDEAIAGADWLITGEGKSDRQTLSGKAPFVVAKRAHRAHVPPTLLSGAVDANALPELATMFAGCFALPAQPMSLADCIERADALLADRAEQIARLWRAAKDT